MTKKNISFFLLYFFTISIFCQVGSAVYVKQLKSFSANESGIADDVDLSIKKVLENLATHEYLLTFNDRKATYRKVKSLNTNESPIVKAMTEGVANFKGTIFFDSASEVVLHQNEFAGVNYLITKNKINWTLTKDTLQIDNYLCYKAKTTIIINNYEGKHKLEAVAWYAPEISIPYGPDGYGGLPGLILQLDYNGIITSLKKIEFNNKNEKVTTIDASTNVEKVSEDEFNSIASKQYAKIKN
jgi:GLPGLI family protein